MPDYNLSGLSTRSFEQLIQALGAKLFGPNLVIFGDGPDGGREATFEGSVPYPSTTQSWNGYGVLQAKFKQRSEGTQKDAEWALQQLRSELEKYAAPDKTRRRPDYYIYATNVVLTPVEEKGSKDRAYSVFQEFEGSVKLKGFDIWDYDKIRTFLDGFEDIRRGYAAWITPGDVLSQVIEQINPKRPDFEKVLTSFLQKELLADQYANLEQAGHTKEDRIPIARVFVDLPAFDKQLVDPPDEKNESGLLPNGFIAEVLNHASERLDPKSISSGTISKIVSESAMNPQRGRFVLIGGPGQGKTTVGQFICQLFRTAILKHKPEFSLGPEVRQAINIIISQCGSEDFDLPGSRRFPIRVVLNQFAKDLASKDTTHVYSLLSYIVDRIRKRTDQDVSPEDFRQWLSSYPWIIVLDGLDEVPASSNREEVLDAVRDFWIDAAASNADILVIATTRPQGYNQDFSPELYSHKWLAPLSITRAMHYARRLTEVRYGSDQDRKNKVMTRLDRATNNEATARLLRSPLQVTIMSMLVDRMGQPPQERWNLFNKYYDVIYQREVERDIPASSILREYKPDVDMIHKRVGLLLQVESERPGKTDARLSSGQFEAVVENRLVAEGHKEEGRKALQESIIEAAADRLVFLVGLEANQVGFEIRSLQEFMAAEGLMEGTDRIVAARLREIAPVPNWRNVFLFAAGKCFATQQHLRDTVSTICAELNEDPDDDLARATLVGSQLALDLLEDGPARRQPKYAQILARLALRLLDLPHENYHFRLSALYNSDLEEVFQEEVERRLANKDPKQSVGAWTCIFHLIDSGVEWAEAMGNTHLPTGKSHQLDLLRISNRPGLTSWVLPKLLNVIPSFSPLSLVDSVPYPQEFEEANLMPAWLTLIPELISDMYLDESFGISLNLEGANSRLILFRVLGIGVPDRNWLAPLNDLPNPSSEWTPFIAAAQFIDHPSRSSLAEALSTIANSYDPEVINWSKTRVPWPLGACMAAAGDQKSLLELADRADAGLLGDIDDWREAEERWRSKGLLGEDIRYMVDAHWPFDRYIARYGFPFIIGGSDLDPRRFSPSLIMSRWRRRLFGQATALIRTLLMIYLDLEQSRIRSRVASWLLEVHRYSRNLDDSRTQELLRENLPGILSDLVQAQEVIGIEWLNLLIQSHKFSDETIDLLDIMGRYPYLTGSRTLPDVKRLTLESFLGNPERVGILKILFFLEIEDSIGYTFKSQVQTFKDINDSSTRVSRIPAEILDPSKYDDPMFKEAAIIVRLAQEDWDDDEARLLAKYTAELSFQRPEIIEIVLEVLSGQRADLFLLELRSQLPPSALNSLRQIDVRLRKSLESRTSRLRKLEIWQKLGLPPILEVVISD